MQYAFIVRYADGDDFSHKFVSRVDVDADSWREAELLAQQMVYMPMPGKPGHIQIVSTREVL